MLWPAVVVFALLAAASALGLGVRLFLGRSIEGSGLDEDGDGELLLMEGSVPE